MTEKNYRQMREALEEIRAKAATMKNGGAWAAGLAMLCLGTLDPPYTAEDQRRAELVIGQRNE